MKFTDTGQIEQIVLKIDEAIDYHAQMVKHWHSKAICNLAFSETYLTENAWENCEFTSWFYSQKSSEWMNEMDFDNINATHKTMHEEMTKVSKMILAGKPVSETDYFQFMNAELSFSHQLRQLKDKITRLQISFDPLTGIFNRQAMMPILLQEHAYVFRDQKKCCLAMADLDHFKQINDNHGHPAGDTVLKQVAKFFRSNLRPYDALFRYGGEEFLFCLPNTYLETGKRLLDRLRLELEKLPIHLDEKVMVTISVSLGIAQMQAETSVDETIDQADQALYEAKKGGRNQIVVFEGLQA